VVGVFAALGGVSGGGVFTEEENGRYERRRELAGLFPGLYVRVCLVYGFMERGREHETGMHRILV